MSAILLLPAVDSMHLLSGRLFPALFHSASCMPCLMSCCHQLSGPSSKPKGGRPSRATKARCLPAPAHPTNNAMSHSHWPIAHRLTSRITVPDTLELSESLPSLFCSASQLSQTSVGCILQGIHEVSFGEERQHKFTATSQLHDGGSPQKRSWCCNDYFLHRHLFGKRWRSQPLFPSLSILPLFKHCWVEKRSVSGVDWKRCVGEVGQGGGRGGSSIFLLARLERKFQK